MNKWKNEPAMIGWLIADDFNAPYAGPAYNHPPAEVAARDAELAVLAPQHLSYASGGSYPGFRIDEFVGTMDLMGFQSYPLGAQNHPDDYALQENMDSFDWVRDQLAGTGQLFIANPQAYKWGGSRYPTPREARNLLYGSLLRGAKGVIWYAMWEGSDRYLPKLAPALWADLPRRTASSRRSRPSCCTARAPSWRPATRACTRRRGCSTARSSSLALDTERSGAVAVSLDLPAGASGAGAPALPGPRRGRHDGRPAATSSAASPPRRCTST